MSNVDARPEDITFHIGGDAPHYRPDDEVDPFSPVPRKRQTVRKICALVVDGKHVTRLLKQVFHLVLHCFFE